MKILLTGANGFIGKNILNHIGETYAITTPSRSELDLCNIKAVRNYLDVNKFDIVIHSANTNRYSAEYEILEHNLQMFFNLESCKDLYGKMYYFGSGAEYDMNHYIPGMKEEYFGTYVPKDAYGLSKYIMSKSCIASDNIFNLRLFGVYGKYEDKNRRFISNAICNALLGKDITIQKNVYFDYLWIDDLCDILKWFIENEPKSKHYNVCRGTRIDLYSLGCMVREVLNVDCDIVIKDEGFKPEYTGNNEKLISEMGEYRFSEYKETIKILGEYYAKELFSK